MFWLPSRLDDLDAKLRRILRLLGDIEAKEDSESKPQHSPISLQLFFGQIGTIMATAVLHSNNKGVTASLVAKDSSGNVVALPSIPAWTTSADGIVLMTVAGDGMSATFAPVAVGTVSVSVVAEGDTTPGVDTIHASGDIQVLGAEAATVDLTFGQVT